MVAPPVQPFEVSVTATTPAGPPPPPSIAADAPAQGGRAPGRLAPGVPESTVGIVPQDTVAAPPSRPRPASPEAAAPASAAMPAAAVPEAVLVQLGVFGTPANADVLRHKVLRNGIVARTETRLQIGPFNDKAEAEAVLAKLKSIGVEAVLVPQP
jgi:DedD protein